jgi:hypothetical protein
MGSTTLTSIETQLHNEDHTDLNGDCLQIQREQFLKLATTGQAAYSLQGSLNVKLRH